MSELNTSIKAGINASIETDACFIHELVHHLGHLCNQHAKLSSGEDAWFWVDRRIALTVCTELLKQIDDKKHGVL